MKDLNNIDGIEKYFNNELNDQEKKALETNIESDEGLKVVFNQHLLAQEAIELLVEDNLRDQLKALEEAANKTQAGQESGNVISIASRRRRLIRVVSLAASVALMIGMFFVIQQNNLTTSDDSLAGYYKKPDFSAERGLKGAEDEIDVGSLKSGLQALEANEYEQAIQAFQGVTAENPYFLSAQYYLGHAHYLNNEYERAEQIFESVAATQDLQFSENAQWYALLSCIQLNSSNCQDKLDQILTDPGHFFYNQAQKINL